MDALNQRNVAMASQDLGMIGIIIKQVKGGFGGGVEVSQKALSIV